VSMGNPHAVVFVDAVASIDLATLGPAFEAHAVFPRKVNTEFVEVRTRLSKVRKLGARVHMRGVACDWCTYLLCLQQH